MKDLGCFYAAVPVEVEHLYLEVHQATGGHVSARSYDAGGNLRWTRQFGTSDADQAYAIATDPSGNLYVAGYAEGWLEGVTASGWDAFIRSYDSDGDLRSTRQFGTSGTGIAFGIATDASGNVYATGNSNGTLQGANAGGRDGFVRSYERDGTLRWTRQFGTSDNEEGNGAAADASGNVYVTGHTDSAIVGTSAGSSDAFVRTYSR